MTHPAYQLDGRPASREAFYAVACDPRRAVCVEACAGAGKTWMLVARIVRALLDGARPHEILAITFTRKAAGEMRTRLAQWLRDAAALTPAQAAEKLQAFGLDAAQARQRAQDLVGLYERVLDSGREVEVRTMHAWYAQLLNAAPLDLLAALGLAPDLTPLEDRSDVMPALMHRFHAAVLGEPPLRALHRRLILRHGRFNLGLWFEAALERRSEIELAAAAGVLHDSVPPPDDPQPLRCLREREFQADVRALAAQLARRDKFRDECQKAAVALLAALADDDERRTYDGLREAVFTDGGKGTPRKHLGSLPEQARLCDVLDQLREPLDQLDAHEDHAAMVALSRVLFAEYAQLKRERGLIDMNDLERLALALLSEHELSGWVQQRLDARVRHLLVDEFQDTSPVQWHALQAWLAGYAGAGGGGDAPSVFIVGDPKQSIYRFRRADPRVFEAAQAFVGQALGGVVAACDHTWRCAPGVVGVLNQVLGDWGDAPGLVQFRAHTTEVPARPDDPPALQILPSAERPALAVRDAAGAPVWRPSLTVPKTAVKPVLREAEAAEVAQAVAQLVQGQRVPPHEILVLSRRRETLVLVADALARQRVPHVAPEDLLLSELPEAQDLVAMLDVLASPMQSLSLARALKSPLFGASDDDLLALARRARGGAWWSALLQCADDASASAALQRAARLCAAWAAAAPGLPPHDLLDRIVHEGELMPRLAAAVPSARRARALDAVRALLATALELDGGRYATPYGFVRTLRASRVAAPASQQDGAVRLLTIHGAKGLEARVVFLVDTQPEPTQIERMSLLIDWPVASPRPACVAFLASTARCPPSLRALWAEESVEREREEANALYVAMTRAEQRLVVSRTPPRGAQEASPSWWSRLAPHASAWVAGPMSAMPSGDMEAEVVDLPLPTPVTDAAIDMSPAPDATADATAAALGQAVHRVLEWAAAGRDGTAPSFDTLSRAAARAFGVGDARAVRRVAERIWSSPECRRFFEPTDIEWSGNEVAIASADGLPRRIDRLVLLRSPERAWWVLDYKLAADPAHDPALQAQLGGYRRAVEALVPGQTVHAAFITGQGRLVVASG
jgi:ATP-dependent helicase/nuclease subunit A